jgi:hypothetical protein
MNFAIATVFVFLFALTLALGVQTQDPDTKRKLAIFATYEQETEFRLVEIKKDVVVAKVKTPAPADLRAFVDLTDAAFRLLREEKLTNPRIDAYEGQWKYIKKFDKTSLTFAERVIPFAESFITAGREGRNNVLTCTVTVTAAKGDGGVIRFIKTAAAAQGGKDKEFGVTVATKDVERAEYIFKCYRNDKETGATKGIACTDTKKPVIVKIPEQ